MDSKAVSLLESSSPTDRTWNFRDDHHQHYFGTIPIDQKEITLTLNWKPSAQAVAKLVGRYRIHLPALEKEGYVRKTDQGYILRFQRTGRRIEIAINRNSETCLVGQKP